MPTKEKYRVTHMTKSHFVVGDDVELAFAEEIWAKIICNFMNGKYNAAKGLMGDLEKRKNDPPQASDNEKG